MACLIVLHQSGDHKGNLATVLQVPVLYKPSDHRVPGSDVPLGHSFKKVQSLPAGFINSTGLSQCSYNRVPRYNISNRHFIKQLKSLIHHSIFSVGKNHSVPGDNVLLRHTGKKVLSIDQMTCTSIAREEGGPGDNVTESIGTVKEKLGIPELSSMGVGGDKGGPGCKISLGTFVE
ncbi:hypothetical protein M5K25_014215 [Dendrobium thyrsiflorum]|uniref:Uncharacterized protein n=1 Tax=Dendrobium thyrsiflorum TaxID=117978 RepID=A0ABD0V1Y3_DENTH